MKANEKLANYMATGMKDYAEGISIMKALGTDTKTVDFLNVPKPSVLHENMLKKKLIEYARVNKIRPAVSQPVVNQVKQANKKPAGKSSREKQPGNKTLVIDANPFVRIEDLPAEYRGKYRNASDLKNQQKTLHAELKALKDMTDEKSKTRRSELSKQIIGAKTEEKKLWAEIDEWWEANKDKTREQRIAESAAKGAIEREKRIKANKTFIQRNYGNSKKTVELENRINELKSWGVDYAEDIAKAGRNTNSAK